MPARALTQDMIALLKRGAATSYGRICYPREARKIMPLLLQMEGRGFLWWGDNRRTPIITDAGRTACGGPSLSEVRRRELAEASQWPH